MLKQSRGTALSQEVYDIISIFDVFILNFQTNMQLKFNI